MFSRALKQILKQNRSFSHILYGNLKDTAPKLLASNRRLYSLAALLQFAIVVGAMEPRKRDLTNSQVKYNTTLESKAQHHLKALKERWMELHEMPGVFSYQLSESRQARKLPGKHGFHAELNSDRSMKRRVPQSIESLNPTFKPKQFNFNKVNELEVMLNIDKENDNPKVQMIINKSPLTKYHSLICPEVKNNLVQRVTPSALSFCINFMKNIQDADMRLGYNSPGALASVNHLHFHLLHMPQRLYIDRVELQELAGGYAYRLKEDSPTEAICFVFTSDDEEKQVREKIANVHRFTEWLCDNHLPHNLFITQERLSGDVRVFVFVRAHYCVAKDVTAFNVGFCEVVGFLPLSDAKKLQSITEQQVIKRIQDVTGDAYASAYEQVKLIVNGDSSSIWWQPFLI